MLKDQLFQITNQKIQTEKEQKNKKIAELKKKSEDNTLYVWNKFIAPGLQSAAKQGNFIRQFRLMENKDEYCYYCVAKAPDTFSYMNRKLHLYYDFPTLIDGYCDINALLKILEQEGFQTAITNCEMAWSEYSSSKKDSGYVLLTVYWGDDLNWNKTKEEIKSKTIKDNNYKTERNKLTAGLRYDILKRDGFKCQICGRSSEEDGVKLHVDHIIPISKGGKTTWDNLRTLCQDCNLGKSNKLEN